MAEPHDLLRDPALLRDTQYATGDNLAARSNLHERYGTATTPFRYWEATLVPWAEVGDVLDVGCGPGRFWDNPELPRDLRISICDISSGMVAEASANITAHGRRVQVAAACDACNLPFADASFDLVVANHMLYHVPTPSVALREFRRVLRPGGRALVATNSPGHMRQLNAAIAGATGPFEPLLNEVFGIDAGEAMLRDVFGAIEWHTFVNALLVTDIEDVFAYATSFPPGQHADAAQLARLRAILAAAIERGNGSMRIDTRTGAFVVSGHAP